MSAAEQELGRVLTLVGAAAAAGLALQLAGDHPAWIAAVLLGAAAAALTLPGWRDTLASARFGGGVLLVLAALLAASLALPALRPGTTLAALGGLFAAHLLASMPALPMRLGSAAPVLLRAGALLTLAAGAASGLVATRGEVQLRAGGDLVESVAVTERGRATGARAPLPFALRLERLDAIAPAEADGAARLVSHVTFARRAEARRAEVATAAPVTFAGWRFHQARHDPADPTFSALRAVHDPSEPAVLLGFALLAAGGLAAVIVTGHPPRVGRRRAVVAAVACVAAAAAGWSLGGTGAAPWHDAPRLASGWLAPHVALAALARAGLGISAAAAALRLVSLRLPSAARLVRAREGTALRGAIDLVSVAVAFASAALLSLGGALVTGALASAAASGDWWTWSTRETGALAAGAAAGAFLLLHRVQGWRDRAGALAIAAFGLLLATW